MSTQEDTQSDAPELEFCSYEEFGLAFFQRAVSVDRIKTGVSGLTGKPIEFGPIGAGPARIAKVTANGRIGEPAVSRVSQTEPLRFLLHIPVDLQFVVSLPATDHRFQADVTVELRLTARAAPPLRVVIDIDPPDKQDVSVDLRSDGITGTVLRMVAGIDGELRKFLVRYIRQEIVKPHIRAARDVDLVPYVDGAEHS